MVAVQFVASRDSRRSGAPSSCDYFRVVLGSCVFEQPWPGIRVDRAKHEDMFSRLSSPAAIACCRESRDVAVCKEGVKSYLLRLDLCD